MGGDGSFEVARSIEIDAPPERVHPLIDRFRSWTEWSPWEEVDPNLEREYSGPDSGVGSKYAWKGNRKAGEGRMEIVESVPPNRVELAISFLKPIKAENQIIFELEPTASGGTEVSWRMLGTQSGLMKLMGKIFSMDKMVGKDFEKGLAQMKSAAEGTASQ